MNQPPAGTITFLLTDIEGSTRLWQEHPEAMPTALRRHHALLSESIAAHGGYVFQIIGDAFCAAFSTAGDGLDAALAAQRGLAAEAWGKTGALRVWLVDLAPLHDPALVPQTIASALDLHVELDRPLVESLVDALREKRLLLILDNCEHVVDACAGLAGKLLGAAPQLKILATSRVPLSLAGETLYPVPPLSLPDPGRATLPIAMTQYEAVRLFIERARAVRPAFGVTNANAPAVAQICQHLDGIPLAIELAAARTRHLSPDEIAARLGDRFNLLTGGSRTALPRHQTLRAAMDWSYDLLSETERVLFNRLAVFSGRFSLEAVEAVCADRSDGGALTQAIRSSQVLDLLGALVDRSLVSLEEGKVETRYSVLETVRQYALEKVQATGEWSSLQDRHLDYYLAFAEQGESHPWTGHVVWTDRFEAEYDNFRAAMAVALARDLESAISMARSLDRFVSLSPRVFESHNWAMQILAVTEAWPPSRLRATALWLAGDHVSALGDYRRAQELLRDSLEMASELGDKRQMLLTLHDLAGVHMYLGDWQQERRYADELMTVALELGDRMSIASALWLSGDSALKNGDYTAAHGYLERSLVMGQQEDLPNIVAHALYSLAVLEHREGNLAAAKRLYMDCAQIWRQMKYQRGLVSVLLRSRYCPHPRAT